MVESSHHPRTSITCQICGCLNFNCGEVCDACQQTTSNFCASNSPILVPYDETRTRAKDNRTTKTVNSNQATLEYQNSKPPCNELISEPIENQLKHHSVVSTATNGNIGNTKQSKSLPVIIDLVSSDDDEFNDGTSQSKYLTANDKHRDINKDFVDQSVMKQGIEKSKMNILQARKLIRLHGGDDKMKNRANLVLSSSYTSAAEGVTKEICGTVDNESVLVDGLKTPREKTIALKETNRHMNVGRKRKLSLSTPRPKLTSIDPTVSAVTPTKVALSQFTDQMDKTASFEDTVGKTNGYHSTSVIMVNGVQTSNSHTTEISSLATKKSRPEAKILTDGPTSSTSYGPNSISNYQQPRTTQFEVPKKNSDLSKLKRPLQAVSRNQPQYPNVIVGDDKVNLLFGSTKGSWPTPSRRFDAVTFKVDDFATVYHCLQIARKSGHLPVIPIQEYPQAEAFYKAKFISSATNNTTIAKETKSYQTALDNQFKSLSETTPAQPNTTSNVQSLVKSSETSVVSPVIAAAVSGPQEGTIPVERTWNSSVTKLPPENADSEESLLETCNKEFQPNMLANDLSSSPSRNQGVANQSKNSVLDLEKPPLGQCSSNFMSFMTVCCKDEGSERYRLHMQLLKVVDLTNISDSDAADSEDDDDIPTNTELVSAQNVQLDDGHTSDSARLNERQNNDMLIVTCVLCEAKRSIRLLVHCQTCGKFYHKRCAKEYGDETICWNCELDGMIDDSELTDKDRDRIIHMLNTLRSSDVVHDENDRADDDWKMRNNYQAQMDDVHNRAESSSLSPVDQSMTKSMQRWREFLDVSTASLNSSFEATTRNILNELNSKETRGKYSKGFTSKNALASDIREVLNRYADLQEQLDRENKEKNKVTQLSSTPPLSEVLPAPLSMVLDLSNVESSVVQIVQVPTIPTVEETKVPLNFSTPV